ncbi:MAG: hypothetical protein ACXACY_26405 [Candidatus Hodarchaeales archaeon]
MNGDKMDDRLENLEILNRSTHCKLHMLGRLCKNKRKLDYDKISELREQGLGYKKISKILGYNRYSVKSAVRVIDKEGRALGST